MLGGGLRDLRRAHGRVADPRHRPARAGPRAHDGASSGASPTRSSAPGRGRSMPSCARSPITSTPMPATRAGGCAASAASAGRAWHRPIAATQDGGSPPCWCSRAGPADQSNPASRRRTPAAAGRLDSPSSRPVVMGMARGGVPVAFEVAGALDAPLDVVVVRKLGHPRQPELGLGAIAEDGVRLVNTVLVAQLGSDPGRARRRRRPSRRSSSSAACASTAAAGPRCARAGRTAIVVDDGLATGFTARAAIEVMRRRARPVSCWPCPWAPRRRRRARARSPTTSCASRRPSGSSASASGTRTSTGQRRRGGPTARWAVRRRSGRPDDRAGRGRHRAGS